MKRLSIPDILKNGESYYSLVIGVSKRARQIVDYANDHGLTVPEKPVSDALEDFVQDRYILVEPKDIGCKNE
ncbi:MAG: DNA-directed RNA polymerase subunit omega [Oscillospiraceae bacterium]|nr:DNA-directed RNA polymerase subunit omega [Oscillospiraceae bacterium]